MTDTQINGLDPQQQQAYDWAIKGKNIFLTGDAGTGKSYTLNTIIDALRLDKTRAVLVSAPTGIAALNSLNQIYIYLQKAIKILLK